MPQRQGEVCERGRRLIPERRVTRALLVALCLLMPSGALARQKARPPAGGHAAVVVDERLAALRDAPDHAASLVRRLGRGRAVFVTGARVAGDGVRFYRVRVTRRTEGWLPAEAVVMPGRAGEDERLLRLVLASAGFDRAARARLFLGAFPRSPRRPAVLLLLGDAAADAAARLTREAQRRLAERELAETGAPLRSYFLNYGGLDRWRRQGVVFRFDEGTRRFQYDGWAWREILRRHPRAPAADEARRRLGSSTTAGKL